MRQLVPGGRTALADPDRLRQAGAAKRRASSKASAPVIDRAPDRLPGLAQAASATTSRRCCAPLDPFLRNLNPILTGLGLYKHEITAAMANVAAATNAVHLGSDRRTRPTTCATLGPFSPESLATYPSRTTTNRNSAYSQPLVLEEPRQPACPTSTPASAARA